MCSSRIFELSDEYGHIGHCNNNNNKKLMQLRAKDVKQCILVKGSACSMPVYLFSNSILIVNATVILDYHLVHRNHLLCHYQHRLYCCYCYCCHSYHSTCYCRLLILSSNCCYNCSIPIRSLPLSVYHCRWNWTPYFGCHYDNRLSWLRQRPMLWLQWLSTLTMSMTMCRQQIVVVVVVGVEYNFDSMTWLRCHSFWWRPLTMLMSSKGTYRLLSAKCLDTLTSNPNRRRH